MSTCNEVEKNRKTGQRHIRIDLASTSEVLQMLSTSAVRFASNRELNDLWFSVDLDDHDFEFAIVRYIRNVFGRRYSVFRGAEVAVHCVRERVEPKRDAAHR